MNKAEIRPLLLEELVKSQVAEKFKHEEVQKETGFQLDRALEEWRAARLKRAQAELQLWLADRQWEKEEREVRLMARCLAEVAQEELDRLVASQTTSPSNARESVIPAPTAKEF